MDAGIEDEVDEGFVARHEDTGIHCKNLSHGYWEINYGVSQ